MEAGRTGVNEWGGPGPGPSSPHIAQPKYNKYCAPRIGDSSKGQFSQSYCKILYSGWLIGGHSSSWAADVWVVSSGRLRYIGPLPSPCQRHPNILSMVATLQQQSTPGPTSRNISPRSPCCRYIHCQRERRPWAYLWNVGRPGSPVARLVETMAEVTCVAWCQESSTCSGLATLVTASDDMRQRRP